MANQEADPGFSVVDRRRRGEEGQAGEPGAPGVPPRPQRETASPLLVSEPVAAPGAPPQADFASFCMMLYGDALVHLGQVPDPVTGQTRPDLHQARFVIDLLAMLKEKTEGNRSPEESAALEQMLSALRMAFVHTRGRP